MKKLALLLKASLNKAKMPVRLEPDKHYHIYNHANGKDDLFVNEGNYHFFLKRFEAFIHPISITYSYCLMPNHFHFLICIKSEMELIDYFRAFPKFKTLEKLDLEKLISKQFSNFFSSYTQAFNKQQDRMGSLFMKNFKRKQVTSTEYLRKLVLYIHSNPVEHGFCDNIEDWKFSSYNAIISGNTNSLLCKEVIELFDDLENFIYCHNHQFELN